MNKKGQGALEYLLLIGGAVLIAAIVLTIMTNLSAGGQAGAEQSTYQTLCGQKLNQNLCDNPGTIEYDSDGDGVDDVTINCAWQNNTCEFTGTS